MCLMLYVGTRQGLAAPQTADVSVARLGDAGLEVVQWFSQPVVQLVGAHTGCSCGFPHVIAESVVEYEDGMWPDSSARAADLRSVSALIQLVRAALDEGESVELYPVWEGGEGRAPKGVVQWSLNGLHAERFFFHEQFMHVARAHR